MRNLKIDNPFWTYCHNFRYGKRLPEADDYETPEGWVYASGLYEGYVRIPWHGDFEPLVSTPTTCSMCGRTTNRGITVVHQGKEVGFCTNLHYIDWWKTQHDDPEITTGGLNTPEQFYKEQT